MLATTYFAGAIGGASEMTLLAERVQARTDLVAAAHSLRVLIVTVLIPFAMQWSGQHGIDLTPPGARQVHAAGLVGLALSTGPHPATLVLGTSPGGIAEMSITAKVPQLGVPVVTALQSAACWRC